MQDLRKLKIKEKYRLNDGQIQMFDYIYRMTEIIGVVLAQKYADLENVKIFVKDPGHRDQGEFEKIPEGYRKIIEASGVGIKKVAFHFSDMNSPVAFDWLCRTINTSRFNYNAFILNGSPICTHSYYKITDNAAKETSFGENF